MNIFEALRKDHDIQRKLIASLIETQGDSERRSELFAELKDQLTSHAAAEERAFYQPLINDDMSQEKARHAIAEHHEIDELIEQLEETDQSSPAWLATAKKLEHKVTHHLDEEEQEFFQIAGKVLTDTQKTRLTGKFKDEKEGQLA